MRGERIEEGNNRRVRPGLKFAGDEFAFQLPELLDGDSLIGRLERMPYPLAVVVLVDPPDGLPRLAKDAGHCRTSQRLFRSCRSLGLILVTPDQNRAQEKSRTGRNILILL